MKEVLPWLGKIIRENGLSVDGCEVELKELQWIDQTRLSARVDMLLTDKSDKKVVFDFKWSNSGSYKKSIEENTALQLAIYKHLARNQFGKSVRAAFILLPSMTFISGDSFVGYEPIAHDDSVDIIALAKNSYNYRRGQFKERKLERAEELLLENSEYGKEQTDRHLFPLKAYRNVISENIYADYKKLR